MSGDVTSAAHAKWIAAVAAEAPSVRMWIYTRSLAWLEHLAPVSTVCGGNLSVNLSADADNYGEVWREATRWSFRICYMTVDGSVPESLGPGDVIFPDYKFRKDEAWFQSVPGKLVCPVDYHGKTERIRCGPCRRCMK